MKIEHTPQERELMRAIAAHRHAVAEEELTAALERANARNAKRIGTAANDNERLQGWELLRQLRRDHQDEDIEVVELYRGLCGLIASNPLQGIDYGYDGSLEKEYRTLKLNGEAEVDEAAACGWKDTEIPGGEIEYREVRKRSRSDLDWVHPPKRYDVANDKTQTKARPFAVKFDERVMVAKMDMRPILEELRTALGPCVDAFEDAVFGGRTLTQIGESRGYSHRQASAVGRELVYISIAALRDAWAKIRRRQRKEAKQAMRNVERARKHLEAKKQKLAA